MILESSVIPFNGKPLFQRARFRAPLDMEGAFKEFACFFYLVEGSMLSYDARGLHRLGENEAVIKSCSHFVQRYVPNEGAEECEAIAIYLYPELLQTIYKDEVPTFLHQENAGKPKKLIGNQFIKQYMSNLALFFQDPESLDEALGILKLKELMLILMRSEGHENIRRLLSEIFAPVNVAFQKTIEQHLFHPLSLEQLAFICHMSLSTFKRAFKKNYNESPARYIKRKRLEHAAHLLRHSTTPIIPLDSNSAFITRRDCVSLTATTVQSFTAFVMNPGMPSTTR